MESKLNSDEVTMKWEDALDLLIDVHQNSSVWSNIYNTKDLTLVTAYKKILLIYINLMLINL